MSPRFRIDQVSAGQGQLDTTRVDLVPGQVISLVVPSPVPGAVYTWELIDKAGSAAALTSATGTTTTIGPSGDVSAFCAFMVRCTETLGAATTTATRIAAVPGSNLGLRPPLFRELASNTARLGNPDADASTDNALYDDLAGTGLTIQNWRGVATLFYEIAKAVEESSASAPGIDPLDTYVVTLTADGTLGIAAQAAMNTAAVIRISAATAGPFNIYGLSWVHGTTHPSKTIINDSSFSHTLHHESTLATNKNRLVCPSATNLVLTPGATREIRGNPAAFSNVGRIDVLPVSDVLTGTLTAGLPAGVSDQILFTTGDAAAADGAQGEFLSLPSDSRTLVPGVVLSRPGGGRLVRRRNWGALVNVKWLGLKDDLSTASNVDKLDDFLGNQNTAGIKHAHLFFPAIESLLGGYLFEEALIPPSGMVITIDGQGDPAVTARTATESVSTAPRFGSVIVVPANVTAFGAHTSGSYSIALRLNNLAILGPGAQLTTGHGVNASVVTGNYDLSTSRVLCMGLDKGVLLRNASAGYHFRLTCIGNKEGVSLGDSVFTPGDNTFADVNLQGNLTGLRIQNARNTLFVRGRIQANRDAIHMGAASPASPGAAGATALTFQQMQIDGNGAATSYWQSGSGNAGWDSGMANGRTLRLETHANNTYANIAAHNTNNSDSAVSIGGGEFHNDITIPHGTWAFHDCQLNSRGRFQGGEVRAKGRNSAGFTSIEVAATLNYEGPDADYVRNVATWAGGTVTHDWAVSGKKVNATLTADTTFEISTNAVTGATFSLQVSQGGAGNHKITWQNIKMLAGAWNERGSDTPGAAASAHFEYFGTTIGWCMVAHSNGYGDNTDTDLHRTIAIADYASYATIYFDTPEPDTNYEVSVNFVNSTGTPASSAFTTSITKRVEGFDVVLGAAPGASTSIVYAVDKYRAKPALNAITQFTSTTLMGTATSGGIAGSAAGWWVEALISLDSATFGQDHPLVGRGSYSGGSGWTIFAKRTGNDFSVALEVYTAVNTRVTSPAILINIRHVGKITHVVFVYDGTTLRTYHRGVQVGSGTTSAFTPATARMIVGNEGSANAAYYTNAVSVIGVQGSHHVPNLAQIQTHMTSVRTARALVEPAFAAALRRYRFDGRASVTNDATNAVSDPITVVSGTAPLTHAILCNQY